MLKTVYFDLGNVLCFFSHEKMLYQLAACSGLPLERMKNLFFETQILKSYELGTIDTKTLYKTLQKEASLDFSLDTFIDAISNIFTPNLEIWKVVEDLKKQSIRLILISNTCETHYEWISRNYPVLQLFDHHILSFKEKLLKPDPKIFEKALEFSYCERAECFYIDDIPAFIASAKTVGLDGEVFTDVPSLQSQLQKRMSV